MTTQKSRKAKPKPWDRQEIALLRLRCLLGIEQKHNRKDVIQEVAAVIDRSYTSVKSKVDFDLFWPSSTIIKKLLAEKIRKGIIALAFQRKKRLKFYAGL